MVWVCQMFIQGDRGQKDKIDGSTRGPSKMENITFPRSQYSYVPKIWIEMMLVVIYAYVLRNPKFDIQLASVEFHSLSSKRLHTGSDCRSNECLPKAVVTILLAWVHSACLMCIIIVIPIIIMIMTHCYYDNSVVLDSLFFSFLATRILNA